MEKLKVYNPYTRKLIREVDLVNKDQIESSIKRAHALHKANDPIPKFKRIEILEKLYDLMNRDFDDLVNIAVKEGGKPKKDSIVEVHRALKGVQLCIRHLSDRHGELIPMGETEASSNRLAYSIHEPLGVVLAISAFNHPVNLIVHQVVTAIAIGTPVIIKPALKTPLSCIKLVDLIYEAGLPVDWCQVLICKNKLTERMARDLRLAYVSFIGSHKVGWHLRSVIAPGCKIVLEHGGVAPVIVERDADMESIIPGLVKGAFYHAGQVCVSVQRIFVHQSIIKKFTKCFNDEVLKLKTGNPSKDNTDVGPLILPQEMERIDTWVNDAEAEGAKILIGGKAKSKTCYEPTVLLSPPAYSYVSSEEIFGPVVSLYSFRKKEEVIVKANKLKYSFQAAIYTKDIDRAMYYSKKLKANAVMINDHTAFRVDWMPFGGSELAGLGIGGIKYSMDDMCKQKLIVLKSEEL